MPVLLRLVSLQPCAMVRACLVVCGSHVCGRCTPEVEDPSPLHNKTRIDKRSPQTRQCANETCRGRRVADGERGRDGLARDGVDRTERREDNFLFTRGECTHVAARRMLRVLRNDITRTEPRRGSAPCSRSVLHSQSVSQYLHPSSFGVQQQDATQPLFIGTQPLHTTFTDCLYYMCHI
jgi:hypothetical protein